MLNSQIMRYLNVDWIDNLFSQNISNLETIKCWHTIKNNYTNGLFDSYKELEKSTASNDILIPIEFVNSWQHNISIPPKCFTVSTLLSTS